MRNSIKLAALAGAVAAALIGGCNSDDTPAVKTVKAESYYRIFALEADSGSDRLLIGSKEGLNVGHFASGSVTIDTTYQTDTIIDNKVRSVVSASDGKYVVAGTNAGISVCLVDENGNITASSSYTTSTSPSLEANNTNEIVLIDNMLFVSSYHRGIGMGEIDPQTGRIDALTNLNTGTTPALPQNTVTALAVDGTRPYILIGTQREGVAVAHYDSGTGQIDAITPSAENTTPYRFVHDIAMHPDGLVLIASNGGITAARLDDNGTLTELHRHKEPELPFRQLNTVAISHDGKKLAAGTFARGVMLADIDSDGALSNMHTFTTKTDIPLRNDHILSLAFSQDDAYLLVGSQSAEGDIVTALEL